MSLAVTIVSGSQTAFSVFLCAATTKKNGNKRSGYARLLLHPAQLKPISGKFIVMIMNVYNTFRRVVGNKDYMLITNAAALSAKTNVSTCLSFSQIHVDSVG